MNITTFIDLTPAQEHTLMDFAKVVVRANLGKAVAVATFTTFQAQEVKVTLDANGVIEDVMLKDSK